MHYEPSIHDNIVYAYSVRCEERRLVLHTATRDHEPHQFTDVVFFEVVAHHFEHVLPGNVLFDVEEADLVALVQANERLFADSWRYSWPPVDYGGDLGALADALTARAVRAYSISSSFGLSDWVLAGRCERVSRSEPATVA